MNRIVLVTIILVVMVIWFSAMANACSPARAMGGGFWGPSWGPPIFVGGGGGWNQGGWDRGGSSSSSSSSPSRSSGGSSTRGGGISGGSGGK